MRISLPCVYVWGNYSEYREDQKVKILFHAKAQRTERRRKEESECFLCVFAALLSAFA
jgi:hypothetical protein